MAKKKVKAPKVKIGPVNNPELTKAISDLKEGNSPEKQHALYKALANASLLSPCEFEKGRSKERRNTPYKTVRYPILPFEYK